jgi:hypothetical protein
MSQAVPVTRTGVDADQQAQALTGKKSPSEYPANPVAAAPGTQACSLPNEGCREIPDGREQGTH